jgi:hypothetical protein
MVNDLKYKCEEGVAQQGQLVRFDAKATHSSPEATRYTILRWKIICRASEDYNKT